MERTRMSILAILLATACTQAPAVEGDEVDSKKDGTAEPSNGGAPTGTAQPESTSNSSPSTANPPMAEPIQPDPPVVPPETPPPPMVGRCDPKKPFGTPKLVAGLNTAPSGIGRLSMDELTTPADERPSWISTDECVLWFSAVGRGSGTAVSELYYAERPL